MIYGLVPFVAEPVYLSHTRTWYYSLLANVYSVWQDRIMCTQKPCKYRTLNCAQTVQKGRERD
jgi:hypothetical protein